MAHPYHYIPRGQYGINTASAEKKRIDDYRAEHTGTWLGGAWRQAVNMMVDPFQIGYGKSMTGMDRKYFEGVSDFSAGYSGAVQGITKGIDPTGTVDKAYDWGDRMNLSGYQGGVLNRMGEAEGLASTQQTSSGIGQTMIGGITMGMGSPFGANEMSQGIQDISGMDPDDPEDAEEIQRMDTMMGMMGGQGGGSFGGFGGGGFGGGGFGGFGGQGGNMNMMNMFNQGGQGGSNIDLMNLLKMLGQYGGKAEYGRAVHPNVEYEAEGGEVVSYKGGGYPQIYGDGGTVKEIAPGLTKVTGDAHNKGGIDMSGGEFVFSDHLKVDDKVEKLLKSIGA